MAKQRRPEWRRLEAGPRSGLGRALRLASARLALAAVGCGSSPAPKAKTAGNAEDEETGTMGGEADRAATRSARPAPRELIPKEKKRAITEDQRADFEKAMQRYASAKKSGGLSGRECSSVSEAFKSVADSNPGLARGALQSGRRAGRVRPRRRRRADLEGA